MNNKTRILLVDDHADTLLCTSMSLEFHGYAVLLAEDVRSAIKVGTENEFDFLVCDINLPDGKGWDVLRALRSIKKFPSIAVTADSLYQALKLPITLGFDLCMGKPYTMNKLIENIEIILTAEASEQAI